MADETLPLWKHLDKLKSTLIKIALVLFLGIVISGFFQEEVQRFYLSPIIGEAGGFGAIQTPSECAVECASKCPENDCAVCAAECAADCISANTVLNFHKVTDSIMFTVKLHFLTGFIIAFPLIILFIWQFVKPALRTKEKKFAGVYLWSIMVLGMLAILYGYVYLLPISLRALTGFKVAGITNSLTAYGYLDFLSGLLIALVVTFQIPLVIFTLIRTGLVPPTIFKEHRSKVYFALTLLMFVLVPGDIIVSALIILPVMLLYEAALILANIGLKKKMEKKRLKKENDSDDSSDDDSGFGDSLDNPTIIDV